MERLNYPNTIMPMRYSIRAVTRDESDLVLQLMCRCFCLDYESAKPIFYSDPFFDLNFKRGLFDVESGDLMSCLTIIPTYLRTGTKPSSVLPIAGIAGVCTEPSQRKRGYAGKLIASTVEFLRNEQNFSVSSLTADSPDYYRNLGWELCDSTMKWSVANHRTFPAFYESEDVRVLTSSEAAAKAPDIHRVYGQAHGNAEVGSFVRDERRWRCIERLSHNRRIAVFERDGAVKGYFAFEKKYVAGVSTVIVDEFAAPTDMSKRGLTGYLGTGKLGFAISGQCRESDLEWLQQFVSSPLVVEPKANLYLRVTHLHNLVSHLVLGVRPPTALSQRDGFAIKIETLRSSGHGTIACYLRASGAKIAVEPLDAANVGAAWIGGDVGAVTQMLFGHRSTSWLMAEGRIRATFPGIADICDTLFQPVRPYLAPPDFF